MMDERLKEYVKLQRETGYSDVMIRDMLLKKGLSEEVADEALGSGQTDKPLAETAPVVVPEEVLAASVPTGSPAAMVEDGEESKGVKARRNGMSAIFFILSTIYSTNAVKLLLLVIVMQQAFNNSFVTTPLLSSFPSLMVGSWLLFALSIYAWYMVFKTRGFSKESSKISFISLLILPPLGTFSLYVSISGLITHLKNMGEEVNLIPFIGWDYLWAGLGILMLYLSRRDQVNEDAGISKKQKTWFGIMTGLSILMMVALTLGAVAAAKVAEVDNFEVIKNQVDYPLYRVGTLPASLTITTNYALISDAGDVVEGVRVGIGTPLTELTEDNSVTIVVNQRPVEEGYMPGQGLTGYEFELVEIPGKSQSAWLGSKPFGDRRLWNLEWVDENQVLVQVTGPVDGRELVLEVAYSLE